ncbi:ArsR/SmtB family transcription factor [Tuwongella immobilis]|uniref:HTH arsR-type domain-containing protein n=1 Tax=Tuwongella immobilis TaxID=692036 RepID=A0A6C2YM76_9BACT|nr:metalloregulator ArsR/SmtB family transcription factor [Tuwongella immobilis]VIP02536.1 family transcriptional regulator : Transcriptional regulator, ArsR family OS=Chondromyces apiculatus DSM 436 GN=CAP_2205 PE=4 SV=1: HTH_20 [Tuwongella immobilis]VTS01697.1 family transcriptional regulator : Transcriptional regulator, ArsR family OS=Chondromyces apiculatus DSM 436 GN=CAP_2205 PE=4 SV=1: HTH_20 [Tuwongella immobilis]
MSMQPGDETESTPHRHPPRSASGQPPASAMERTAQLFRALGDTPRLRLLHLLLEGEWCVSELVATTGEKFSTMSQRLRILRSEGLVNRRRDGNHIFYSLQDQHVADLIRTAVAHAMELESVDVPIDPNTDAD